MGELEYEKQALMSRLLDAVKQCQIRFGGKTELATEIDSRVSCLCYAWESIMQHGMKHSNKTLSALKQMTEIAGLSKIGLLEDVKNMETEPAFWQYVKHHLSTHELQRYTRLNHVTSDAGRGRAWIRASLNEHALERYMHMLIESERLLSVFYEDWAFLRDQEKRHVLPNAAAGLKSVLFAIAIDNHDLNTIRPARGLEEIVSSATGSVPSHETGPFVPRNQEPRPVIGGSDVIIDKKKEKKKKKKTVKIVSFDDALDESAPSLHPQTFTSASLPCTPRLANASKFDSFSVSSVTTSETGRSVSSESSASSSKLGDSPRVENCSNVSETVVAAEDVRNGNVSNTNLMSNALRKATSKSSLNSVSSSKSEQSYQVRDVLPKDTSPTKGHRKSHSDTSMFSNIGTKLFKSVISVSKFKFSSEDVSHDDTASDNKGNNDSVTETNRRGSVGSFDNVSLADVSQNSNASEPNVNNGSADARMPILGSSVPTDCFVLQSQNNQLTSVQNTDTLFKPVTSHELVGSDKIVVEENHVSTAKQPLRQSYSTGALPKNQQYKHDSYSSIYGPESNDSSALTPLDDDSYSLTEISFRAETNMLSSSPNKGSYNFMENTQQASLAIALAQQSLINSETMRTQGDGSHFPDPVKPSSTGSQDNMTTSELKEAIMAMMKRKDEVEEENRHIRLALEGELEVSNTLRLELTEAKKSHQGQQERDNNKIKDLSRENELLKHQLRKYVSAVQMLRREGATDTDFPGLHLDEVQPAVPPLQINTDFIQEATDYESKLIQVAEMHGELMEFNEFLHKQLVAKDNCIRDLRQELEHLRGPLPQNIPNAEDDWSIISEMDGLRNRPLVNIWIPAAFLKGKGSQNFHVYQVYIRIRDEEWNVYRRYTEFHDLHQFLKRRNPIVNTFNFPKKKTIGNKDEKFVEQRRKHLQTYLRKVINLIVQINTNLSVEISRHKLMATVPFFGDTQPRRNNQSAAQSTQRRRVSSSSEPHYSGL